MKTYIKHTKDKSGKGILLHWTDGGQMRQDPRRPHEGKGKRGQGDGRGPQRVHGVQQGKDKGVIGLYV